MSTPSSPRTSIIMPVYNTADRVLGAIRSVLDQTDPDWELLVLIDASPDDAAARIAAFLAEHPDERVHVFDNPRNQGVSAVRNQGLDEARGEWVAFLDSDDCLRPNFLSTLHAFARDTEADVAVCGHTLVRRGGVEHDRFRTAPGVYGGEQAGLMLLRDEMTSFVWDKMVRRDVIGATRFPLDVHRGEDAIFSLAVLAAAHRVVVIPSSLYEYAVDASSLTWGRVAAPEESLRLMAGLRAAAGPLVDTPAGQRAYAVSWVLIFLNAAQQALVNLTTAAGEDGRAPGIIRDSRRRITWRQLAATAPAAPLYAAAGTLLKLSPFLYRVLYGAYIRRVYGL